MRRSTPSIHAGQRFGRWTTLCTETIHTGGRDRKVWLCRCDCGLERHIAPDALANAGTSQCRTCANRLKAARKPRLTHGQSSSRLYNIWCLMRKRCSDPDSKDYSRYGGRGITVCAAWTDYLAFHSWAIGNGYADYLTLDRRSNEGNYEPSNCRWESRTTQNRNRRNNQRFAWRGRRLMLSEIAEIEGISHNLLRQRVRRDGLTIADAIARPIRSQTIPRRN